ncbi:MAG: hypothetical protein ACOYMN_13570 [Roseimicrobium sp.]
MDPILEVFHSPQTEIIFSPSGLRGGLTRAMLGLLFWDEPRPEAPQGYSVEQQQRMIDTMVEQGLIFPVRPGNAELGIETEYLAPDLLPARHELPVLHIKLRDVPTLEACLRYEGNVWRKLMCKIGADAKLSGVYWLGGLCAYDQVTDCLLMVENRPVPGGGWLRLSAQGERPAESIENLVKWLGAFQADFRQYFAEPPDHSATRPSSAPASGSAPTATVAGIARCAAARRNRSPGAATATTALRRKSTSSSCSGSASSAPVGSSARLPSSSNSPPPNPLINTPGRRTPTVRQPGNPGDRP